jgi:hydrogenase nickel incorporation protein HypA/HybF
LHEFSVLSYLMEAVEEQAAAAGASRVVAINLVVGDRASIIDDLLLYYFDMLAPGTLAEGAQLNLRRVPMRFTCSRCDTTYTPAGEGWLCPDCGTIGQLTDDGSELLIESIEVEREQAAWPSKK